MLTLPKEAGVRVLTREAKATPLGLRRGRNVTAAAALPVLGLVLVIALWWGATAVFDVQRIVLPAPPDVVEALFRLPDHLLEHGQVTLVETLLGFGLAVAGGLLIGMAIATSRIVNQMAFPWLVAFNAVPKVALAPMLIVWLGFEMQPKVAMVVLVCFFPIVLATATGLTNTPSELTELARSLDSSRWRTFVKIRLPQALPHVFVGLKVAMPLAVIGAVIGEFAGGSRGLGHVIRQSSGLGDTALAFAAIVVLSVMSIALFYEIGRAHV